MSSLFAVCPAPFQKPKKKGKLLANQNGATKKIFIGSKLFYS